MPRTSWHSLASEEVDAAIAWHLERSPGTVTTLLDAIDEAMRRVQEFPENGAVVRAPFRRMVLNGYPFAVIYEPTASEIRVLAFANTSRKPEYWLGRR